MTDVDTGESSHRSGPPLSGGDAAPTDDGLRGLVVYSLLAGVCPLIPIPLLDDWVLDRVRRRLVARLADEAAYRPAPAGLEVLADRDPTDWRPDALARGCLRKLVVAPVKFVYKRILKKLLRKVLFVLAIKDAVDEFSTTFHHAWLLRHAFARGRRPSTRDGVWTLRRQVDAVRDEIDPRPLESAVRSAFRHSRRLLRQAARTVGRLGRALRRRRPDEGAAAAWVDAAARQTGEEASGLVDELLAGLRREHGYLTALQRRLDRHLDNSGEAPGAGGGAGTAGETASP